MSAPNEPQAFTDPAYWKNFFAKRKTPFEWYGDYNSLSKVMEKYLKPSDKFLQLGCGNSELATQLYENGFHDIHSIDVEPSVIADQTRKNKERPGMSFAVGDAAHLEMADGAHTVVIDKGTLDALLPPAAEPADKAIVTMMFDEVHRVLASGGRYIIVTLAQPHITEFWIDHFFPLKQYILRVQKVENKASGFQMPVFCFIATKMRSPMPNPLPLEVMRSSSIRTDRIQSTDDLKEAILAEQELSQFIFLCAKKLETEVSIDFHGEDPSLGPRYRICVVDNQEVKKIETFAAFVVPIGRMMIGSLALSAKQPLAIIDTPCKMAVLGLGGGLLTAYLVRHFRKARVTAVELDPDVAKIANTYFSFPHSDSRINVIIQDALIHLAETATKPEEEKYDVIFVDVSGSQNAALQCPPPSFLTPEALLNMKNSLKESGMISLNLVTRDSELGKAIKSNIAEHFPTLYAVLSFEDVNEVIVGLKAPKNTLKPVVPQKLSNTVRKNLGSYDDILRSISNIRMVDY
ncbi:hypothetical protein CAEBREN_08006 [Caenorhabditis brenneri]|uniref:Methyltransferase domain-containing protein n=1 Tax=Caenorhabditis brenneri TaxID=135651 RepID=G0PF34_CAEBE|nr:hypothetical protein CAEBREN_08006 [Caenorhabditis brenneri]